MRKSVFWRVIGILIIILLGIALFLSYKKPKPPVIKFVGEKNNRPLSGVVYFDDIYMGRVYEDGFFNDMPKEYCNGKHTITLKSSEYILKWDSLPSDCGYGLVTLNYEEGE